MMVIFYVDFMFSLYLYLIGCLMFSFFYKHLLMTVISLELMTIYMYMNMYNIYVMIESNIFLMMLVFVLAVCEGAMALTLIVLMVRLYGNDYINSLMILKW